MLANRILFRIPDLVVVIRISDHLEVSDQVDLVVGLDGEGDKMVLPQRLPLALMQVQWAAMLNPLLSNNLNSVNFLENIALENGVTIINHFLGRPMQGWFLTDIQGAATIYRSSPFNNLTLTLTSSAAVTVNIGVF